MAAPIETPPSFRDFMAFERHVDGMGQLVGATRRARGLVPQPLFYFSNPAGLRGPMRTSDATRVEVLDFELEVAAVVGPARDGGRLAT